MTDQLLSELREMRSTRTNLGLALIADPTGYVLSATAGGLLLPGYVAAFVTAGAVLVARRDVT
jgi:hypothetical protein